MRDTKMYFMAIYIFVCMYYVIYYYFVCFVNFVKTGEINYLNGASIITLICEMS